MQWLNLPETKITRFYPGADTLYAEPSRNRNYSRIETLLFAGTWIKRKGTADLIPAFIKLAARYSDLRLTVLGAGVPASEVLNSFPDSIRSRVAVLQSDNEVENAQAFADADIYVLPSLFEGTPLTLMEAMMSGLPVITTNVCGMRDVIRHEQNGLLIPIRSPEAIEAAMERLINDAGLRARLGAEARHDAISKYTWEAVAAPIGSLYRQLCKGAGER